MARAAAAGRGEMAFVRPVAAPLRRGLLRPRWADLRDGDDAASSDNDREAPAAAPETRAPVAPDDSYRGAPVAQLEDSRGGLNARLAGILEDDGGDRHAPQDFAFLLARPPRRHSDGEDVASASSGGRGWRFNPEAREFIPTLTVKCIGIAASDTTPVKDRAPSPSDGDAKGRPRRRGGKRRLPALQVQIQKRTKSEERMAPPPPSADPTPRSSRAGTMDTMDEDQLPVTPAKAGSSSAAARAAELEEQKPSPKGCQQAMPEATEEEWLHRADMRQKAVDITKTYTEYQWFSDSRARGERMGDEPQTPDPRDRSISKRKWKYLTAQWRNTLKQRYVEEGRGSVISTEEWQSQMTALSTEDAECLVADDASAAAAALSPVRSAA